MSADSVLRLSVLMYNYGLWNTAAVRPLKLLSAHGADVSTPAVCWLWSRTPSSPTRARVGVHRQNDSRIQIRQSFAFFIGPILKNDINDPTGWPDGFHRETDVMF